MTLECEKTPDKFFSEAPALIEEAKSQCNGCPVREECAELGENAEYGVWGGMTPDEIRRANRFRVMVREELINSRIRRMHAANVPISAMVRELSIPRKTLADRLRKLTTLAA